MSIEQPAPNMPVLTDADLENMNPRLLQALASLNQIGAAINSLRPSDHVSVDATLRMIVESAIKVVPGASAVIYIYDQIQGSFDIDSRVSAGEPQAAVPNDAPRPDGIGMRAIQRRQRVLSYEEQDLDIHPVKVQVGAKAMACYPLIVAHQVVGALYVYLHQPRRFSQFELLMLDNFVNQAAIAIHQARQLTNAQRDLMRKEDELNRLRHAGLLISSRLGLEKTLEAILEMALEVTNAHYGIFRLLDKSGEHLVTHAIAGEHLTRPQVKALPIDAHSVMGWVAQHRQPTCIQDLRLAPWNGIYYPLDAKLEMRSELAVPLIGAGGRLEGVLNLESPRVGAFGKQDSHLLQSLATQAVVAIQEARLLDALLEVAQLLLFQTCQQVLKHLADLACDLLNSAASAIWLTDGDRLVLQIASAGYQRDDHLPLVGSLTGKAVLHSKIIKSQDVRTDPRFHRQDLARIHGWTHALVVPILSSENHEPIGAFSVYGTSTEAGRFTESELDEKVLTCLAYYAALSVQSEERQNALRAAQKKQAIAETFAAVGDIAANVLHHLNNKVGTIPVRIQGIQDKCQLSLQADSYLEANLQEIEHSAREAMSAVREHLSHLRPIHSAHVNVAACVKSALETASLPDSIRVQLGDLAQLPTVVAGQQSLTLVFTNLLENASDAMRGVGTIAIQGTADDECVEVTIRDNGPGIPPELHDRIFEFNFSGNISARPNKLGFGLWWVKTLMMRLGGTVSVESVHRPKDLGENDLPARHYGTTFRLQLPRGEAQ